MLRLEFQADWVLIYLSNGPFLSNLPNAAAIPVPWILGRSLHYLSFGKLLVRLKLEALEALGGAVKAA
jgi:hypothetical protein